MRRTLVQECDVRLLIRPILKTTTNLTLDPAKKSDHTEHKSKPRLLVILNRFVIGGQAIDTIPLLYLLQDRYEVKIVYGKKEADETSPLFLLEKYPGLPMFEVQSLQRTLNPFSDIRAYTALSRIIREFKPDIVHTHGAKSGLLGRVAAYFNHVPVIVHTFHGHVFHSYFNRFVTGSVLTTERCLAKISSAAIALSPSQKNEICLQYRVFTTKKVHVVPLGIEFEQVHSGSRKAFRKQYGLADTDVAIAIIGRIVPIKEHLEFLRIAHIILQENNKRAIFFIIGDGSLLAGLYKFLDELGAEYSAPGKMVTGARIIFTSWLSDMPSAISGIDIVALTSRNEGTPVSLIEAQLGSRPVVAYNVGGVKDTFQNNVSGFLVQQGEMQEFVEKLLMLINNEDLRKRMGEEGKLYCSQKFSKLSEVNATNDLYRSLLAKHELATL